MQSGRVKRREFMALLGGAATWPLAARAQQAGKISRVGFLANDPNIPAQPAGRAFLDGLRESGFIEGKNVVIERRFAEGRIEQYATLVSELINWGPDVIVTSANDATLAAKQATAQIPIVMMNVFDPVGQGIVPSLAHPGGNITAVIQDELAEIAAKRLQLLKDAVPNISRVAVLINLDDLYANVEWKALEQASQSLRGPEPIQDYTFRRAEGTVRLSELFSGKDTLIVIHNMGASCPYCTLWADGFNGVYEHLRSRASFVVASPDAPEQQQTFAQSRGWRFPMISIEGTTFAQDMGYWRDDSPVPGVSVFKRSDGRILRVADTSFSPCDDFCVVWHFLDLIPEGGAGWEPKYRYTG